MEIMRALPDGSFDKVGMRCDRCGQEVRACRSLEEYFAMFEFVRIDVHAGYGADYFADGDSWAADLCERCVHKLLAPYLRLTFSYEERELHRAISREEDVFCSEWIEHLREAAAERRMKPVRH